MNFARTEQSQSCPFVTWLLAFLAAMLLGTFLGPPLAESLHAPWLRYPVTVVSAASLIAIIAFQTSARGVPTCPWLPLDFGTRVALFGVAFLVGLVVIYPAVNLRGEVLLPWRLIGIVCVASVLAFITLHLRAHKRPGGAGSGDRLLAGVAQLPFFLLCAMVLVIIVVGVIEIVTARP